MNYWESAEVEKSVYQKLAETRGLVSRHIAKALEHGALSNSDWEFCYLPIVMGPDFVDLYPSRIEIDLKEKKFYYCPQLNFDTFLNGSIERRVSEYLKGIRLAADELGKKVLDKSQVSDFELAIDILIEDIHNIVEI